MCKVFIIVPFKFHLGVCLPIFHNYFQETKQNRKCFFLMQSEQPLLHSDISLSPVPLRKSFWALKYLDIDWCCLQLPFTLYFGQQFYLLLHHIRESGRQMEKASFQSRWFFEGVPLFITT